MRRHLVLLNVQFMTLLFLLNVMYSLMVVTWSCVEKHVLQADCVSLCAILDMLTLWLWFLSPTTKKGIIIAGVSVCLFVCLFVY